jgi:Tfp pilus assembly protein PilW
MTRSSPRHGRRAIGGFSLVELMIALVAGLIVVGAVLAFTVSSVQSNSDFVRSARLMQELRNVSDYVTAELKRAGYDEAAMDYVANPSSTAVSAFAPILVDTSNAARNCVIYAYDRQPGNPGAVDADNGEIRAFRRSTATLGGQTVGVIEVGESSSTATPTCGGTGPDYSNYPATCNTATGWCPLSDPRILDVSTFTVSTAKTDTSGGYSRGKQTIPGSSGFNAMQLRELEITMTGNLRNDTTAARSVKANIKVRADCLRANIATCDVAPTP